jgi:hypothetical protein
MTDLRATRLSEAFADLGRIDFRKTDLATGLARVAETAERSIPGADDVSVTILGPDGAHTAAFTGLRALAVDELERTAPCRSGCCCTGP